MKQDPGLSTPTACDRCSFAARSWQTLRRQGHFLGSQIMTKDAYGRCFLLAVRRRDYGAMFFSALVQIVPPTSTTGLETHTTGIRATLTVVPPTEVAARRRLHQTKCATVPVVVNLYQDYVSCEAFAMSVGNRADYLQKCKVCPEQMYLHTKLYHVFV